MLQQYRKGGTWYGYDPTTQQLIAFSSLPELKKVFPNGIDMNAPDLPVDPTPANSKANQMVSIAQPGTPAANAGIPAGQPGSPWSTGAGPSPAANTPPAQAPLPDSLLNDPFYKQLTPENQEIIKYYWQTMSGANTNTAAKFQEAMDLAAKDADPYFREKINIVKDELARVLGKTSADLADEESKIAKRRQDILDDLTYNKEQLSLEQQAELSRQAQTYGDQLDTLRETMANRGLSSSSIRTRAEEKASDLNNDVIESTTRKYAREERSQQLTADRSLRDMIDQINTLQRSAREINTNAVRTAEAKIGSNELIGISGADPLKAGNYTGTFATDKANDILARAMALLAKNNPNLT